MPSQAFRSFREVIVLRGLLSCTRKIEGAAVGLAPPQYAADGPGNLRLSRTVRGLTRVYLVGRGEPAAGRGLAHRVMPAWRAAATPPSGRRRPLCQDSGLVRDG
jgi:hypothetical protein